MCVEEATFSNTGNEPCSSCKGCGKDEQQTETCSITSDTICEPSNTLFCRILTQKNYESILLLLFTVLVI